MYNTLMFFNMNRSVAHGSVYPIGISKSLFFLTLRKTSFILLNAFYSRADRLVLMLGGTKNGHALLIFPVINKRPVSQSFYQLTCYINNQGRNRKAIVSGLDW